MKRREFLRTAVVGVGAAGLEAGCATARPPPERRYSIEQMDAFLAQFDRGLASIDRSERLGPLRSPGNGQGSSMVKRALRSLYAVGAVADLDVEDQAHPGVQARVARLLPEMEHSLRECAALVEGMSPRDAGLVREALRADPSLPVQLSEWVDDAGGAAGVSARTRRKFRLAATHVGFRLRHQDPILLTGEYVAKVRKIEAWSGDDARFQRQIAGRVGQEVLLADQARFRAAQLRWAALGADGVSPDAPTDAVAQQPAPEKPGAAQLRAAAWCFGIAIVAGGLGAILASSSAGAVGAGFLTVAVVLLIVAIILAIIGAVRGSGDTSEARPSDDLLPDRADRLHTPAPPSAVADVQET